jgi:hypothetical protein
LTPFCQVLDSFLFIIFTFISIVPILEPFWQFSQTRICSHCRSLRKQCAASHPRSTPGFADVFMMLYNQSIQIQGIALTRPGSWTERDHSFFEAPFSAGSVFEKINDFFCDGAFEKNTGI